MPDARQEHWSRVYRDKTEAELSWYQASPEPSLQALQRLGAGPEDALVDVGAGSSSLVDALLQRGWRNLTVLDIAPSAIAAVKARLGPQAAQVDWQVADITRWTPGRQYDVWHDRAVFHFLTEPAQRDAYRAVLDQALAPGGLVIIATFALHGPEKCSGLPVRRYDAESLARELGPSLQLVDHWQEDHVTPWGSPQAFIWCAFRRA
jgi:trans-aconitate methyltransferase